MRKHKRICILKHNIIMMIKCESFSCLQATQAAQRKQTVPGSLKKINNKQTLHGNQISEDCVGGRFLNAAETDKEAAGKTKRT